MERERLAWLDTAVTMVREIPRHVLSPVSGRIWGAFVQQTGCQGVWVWSGRLGVGAGSGGVNVSVSKCQCVCVICKRDRVSSPDVSSDMISPTSPRDRERGGSGTGRWVATSRDNCRLATRR